MDVHSRRQSRRDDLALDPLVDDLVKLLGRVTVRLHGTVVHVRVCMDGWEANHQYASNRTSGQAWLAWGRMKGDVM